MSFSISVLYYSIPLRPPLLITLVLVASGPLSIGSLPGSSSAYIPSGAL
jgi:hypothetical protein